MPCSCIAVSLAPLYTHAHCYTHRARARQKRIWKKILARKLSILKSQFVEQFASRFMWLCHWTVAVAQFAFICSKFVNDSWQNGFLYFWTGCCWCFWVCRCVDFQAKLTTYLILHFSVNVNARPVVTFSICQLVNFLKYLHFFINATPTHTKESPT